MSRGLAGASSSKHSSSESPKFHLPHVSSSSSASTFDMFTDDCLTTEDIKAWHELKFRSCKESAGGVLDGLPDDLRRLLDKAPNFSNLSHMKGDGKRLVLEALRRHEGGSRTSPTDLV